MKRDGIRTLVRKLRLCQSARGRSRTRVEGLAVALSDDWRTTFRLLFFGKRIGTIPEGYKCAPVKQNLLLRMAGDTLATTGVDWNQIRG